MSFDIEKLLDQDITILRLIRGKKGKTVSEIKKLAVLDWNRDIKFFSGRLQQLKKWGLVLKPVNNIWKISVKGKKAFNAFKKEYPYLFT